MSNRKPARNIESFFIREIPLPQLCMQFLSHPT